MRNLLITLICVSTPLLAQNALVNLDFEEWVLTKGQGNYRDYEEPFGWTSGNGVIHVAPNTEPLTTKSLDAYSGTYCVKMTTSKIFNQIAAGSCFTGRFVLNLADPVSSARRGIPFTQRPAAFAGHFKYEPVGGDSAAMYAILSRWDNALKRRVTVGSASVVQTSAVATWSAFVIPFVYHTEEVPDTISVVFASSAAGDSFKGDAGSTLWVDALRFGPISSVGSAPSTQNAALVVVGRELRAASTSIHITSIAVYALNGEELFRSDCLQGDQLFSLQRLPAGPVVIHAEIKLADNSSSSQFIVALLPP